MKLTTKPGRNRSWGKIHLAAAVLLGCLALWTIPVQAASNKNVWIEDPVYTRDSAQNMTVCLGDTVQFHALTMYPATSTWSWSGATIQPPVTGSSSYANKTFSSAGGPYSLTATCNGETSFAALVKVLEVATAQASGATQIAVNGNEVIYTVCKGTGNVTVTATSNPNMTEQQLQGTCWSTSDTSGGSTGSALLTRTVSKSACRTETITFTAGTSEKKVTVKVLDVQITSPQVLPPSANDFTYDTASVQNTKCIIAVEGTTCDSTEDTKLEWTLSAIYGATLTSNPNPAKGANVTFTYTRMPTANSQLGNKTLTLNYPPTGCSKSIPLQIFFPKYEKNHPGGLATPNWHYYWQQAGVSPGGEVPTYWETLNQPGVTLFVNGVWTMYVDDDAAGTFSPVIGPQSTTQFDGIDAFAYTWRHELQHKLALTTWFPQGHDSSIDADNDDIPDAYEATILPAYGGPYSTNNAYTHGHQGIGITDGHEYVYRATQIWSVGTANAQDWAKPGHQ